MYVAMIFGQVRYNRDMRNVVIGVFIGILLSISGYYGKRAVQNFISSQATVSPLSKILEKPLEKYSILRLSGRKYEGSQIVLDEATATTSAYTVYKFHYLSDGKKVTGVAHLPAGPEPAEGFPVIVQFRGYIDREIYKPGDGTRHSAEVYAATGFISLAPDFLGFGGSDKPSTDVFEERFETYTTALNLLASVRTLPMADATKIGIWGHSNGGQIALTVLEIIGKPVPATLWAPVSKPFPYSILYYTDDFDDHGKALRKKLADFEKDYNVELYSLTNYLDRITGPVQIHQGESDDAVPVSWSDALAKTLKAPYFTYPGADHDFNSAWKTVVARDISFFTERGK
jgi:dipeptidyl aminopeptidase/acylaminoacyl peptidase